TSWSAAVTEDTMRRRVARWPVLNMLHLLLAPLLAALRGRIIPTTRMIENNSDEVVRSHVARLPLPLSLTVQAAFAQLQQASPLISQLYVDGRLWEPLHAEQQVGELAHRLAGVLDARAAAVRDRLSRGGGPMPALVRFML